MAYSQKYTIVQFLEQVEAEQEFSMENWPLHITLADIFAIELNQSLIDQLTAFLATQHRFSVMAMGEGNLGSDNNPTKVTMLENTAGLQSLHNGLVELLAANGAVFNSPKFTGPGFLPHATQQNHARLNIGQQVTINNLSLVDMFVGENWRQRKILKNFELKA